MAERPTGTVTFLFSDIQGSTRLLESLGDGYAGVLQRHRQIVRDTFAAQGGVEISTEGDSFFAVFPRAQDSVSAAVAIQRDLAREEWPNDAIVRLRIGLHTGEGRLSGTDYVGMDVHRAARIMAAAHGGQVLVSDATRESVESQLPTGIELRDLGEHRLRDLSGTERLFQIVADDLPDEFPVLRSLNAVPNNLPMQSTPMVGRATERAAIREHLESARVRLLTLTGPGGIGKTRLGLQAAADAIDRFPDGVYFVDLSPARDAPAALDAIVRAVGMTMPGREEVLTEIGEQLRGRQMLLVLDNFEQVMSAADDLATLLGQCPHLKVLVTSREALRIRGEQLFTVAPLSLPAVGADGISADEASTFEAVRLFIERAREAEPRFELTDANAGAVARICAQLDGLPLAIELAAARLRLFSPEELNRRLQTRLEVLGGGARDLPERQRTLRSTIEWSYELLDADERSIFQLLSLFSTARVEAVEEVGRRLPQLSAVDVIGQLALAGGQEPGAQRPSREGAAPLHARHDPRVRCGAARRRVAGRGGTPGARGVLRRVCRVDAAHGRQRRAPGRCGRACRGPWESAGSLAILPGARGSRAAGQAARRALVRARRPWLVPRGGGPYQRPAGPAGEDRAGRGPSRRGDHASAQPGAWPPRDPRLHGRGRGSLPRGA